MRKILTILFIIVSISSCRSQSIDTNIVLINVGEYDKGRIAKSISKINSLKPKVIALDIAFPKYTGDTNDRMLYHALQNARKLVMPSEIVSEGQNYQGQEIITVYLTYAMEFYMTHAKTGFVSAKVEKSKTPIQRQFIVSQKASYNEDIYFHFSILTAMGFDSLKASKFIQHHEALVDIDYKNGKRKFKIFSAADAINGRLKRNDIEGKIVMFGFLGPGNDDKFFTPLNNNPEEPDMYGVEYLANIVSQVLEFK